MLLLDCEEGKLALVPVNRWGGETVSCKQVTIISYRVERIQKARLCSYLGPKLFLFFSSSISVRVLLAVLGSKEVGPGMLRAKGEALARYFITCSFI